MLLRQQYERTLSRQLDRFVMVEFYITCMSLRNHADCIGNYCDAVLSVEIIASAACWHSPVTPLAGVWIETEPATLQFSRTTGDFSQCD